MYDDGEIKYDASLNQTNIGANNNKFYILQMLQPRTAKTRFLVWTRWGRVGENGQSKLLGPFNDFDSALKEFNKKFKDKTGCVWDDRLKANKNGKYWYLEKDYAPPEDEEDEKKKKEEEDSNSANVVSKLEPEIQSLMELIFNKDFMQQTMIKFNYDSNKLPLGRLSKSTIKNGYLALKKIAEILADLTAARAIYGANLNPTFAQLTNEVWACLLFVRRIYANDPSTTPPFHILSVETYPKLLMIKIC